MSNTQIALPIHVRPEEVARKQTFGQSIELCAELAGYSLDKSALGVLKDAGLDLDKGQFSRWQNGTEGVIWDKLEKVMNAFGNDAPILWMNHRRGYDLHSMRKRQTETEQALAIERDARIKAEERVNFLTQVLQGKVAA